VRARRPWWPWLLAVGAALAIGIGGYFLWDSLQSQIDANEPVAVDNYEGILEQKAVELIRQGGFEELVQREANTDVEEGYVFDQEPSAGTRLPKGGIVTIVVSTGKPKVTVPTLVGKTRDEAVQELAALGLDVNVVEVNSPQAGGTVTAQDPAAGTVLVAGSTVRINVSKGPKQVAVPNVVGLQVDIATAQLNTAGFPVLPQQVESDRPAGEVVAQDPPGNSTASAGSTVSLSVSKGPSTVAVPDVTLLPVSDARATLIAAGFKVAGTSQDTDDPSLDGVVISQDPAGEAQAEPGSKVTLTIGRYVEPPPAEIPPVDTTGSGTGATSTTPAP
jgi:serine/threonine-protein kinase